MKRKVPLFVAILILSLWAVHCEKGVTPFNPESDVEKQSESGAASENTGTVSRTTGMNIVGIGKGSTTIRDNLKSKDDFHPQHASADRRIGGKVGQNRVSGFMAEKSELAKGIQTTEGAQEFEKRFQQNQKMETEAVGELRLNVQPDQWNKNWTHSEGLVTARIRGEGFDKIVPGTITMAYGPCLEANSLQNDVKAPVFEQLGGSSYIVKFRHSDAISLVTDPKRGEKHWIHISGQMDGEDFCLDHEITIIGKKDEVDLSLVIRPKKWNISWVNGETSFISGDGDDDGDGLITVRISGIKFEDIEPGISMDYGSCQVGDASVLAAIPAVSEQMGGNAYIAKFDKIQAIGLIPELIAGETHYIHVTGNLADDGQFCLDFMITLVGKKLVEDELTLDIKPDKWDLSWADGASITLDAGDDGFIRARIRGEGFENIDPSTVRMSCASCDGDSSEIEPIEHEFGGSSLVVKFLKSDAIGLIPDPKRGEVYIILVSGQFNNDTNTFEATDSIQIKGKKK